MSNEDIKELRALDKVRLVNIPPPHDFLNGKEAFIQPLNKKREGTVDPGRAKLPDGRYEVTVFQDNTENSSEDNEPAYYKVKRGNLILVEAGEVSKAINSVPTVAGVNMRSTAETVREYPGLEGWFPAISQGDIQRCREILEYIRMINYNAPFPPADAIMDLGGDTALSGAIQEGHSAIVDLLIEYGADVNRKFGELVPMTREMNMCFLHLAISVLDIGKDKNVEKAKQRQDIVVKLIECGADVSISSNKGTPLELVLSCDPLRVPWQYKMLIVKLLLQKGADPNAVDDPHSTRTRYSLSFACSLCYFGTEENRLEIVQMLLDHGADPGIYVSCRNQVTTTLHNVVSRRQWQVLQVLLESEKGQQAVNKKMIDIDDENGCTPLFLALNGNMEERFASRKCITLLLQYGASVHIPNASGCPPYYGLTVIKTPKVKQLKHLVDNAPAGEESIYWTSSAVDEWVGTWNKSAEPQCPVCLQWTDDVAAEFKTCSRCKSEHYCSQKCQKINWKEHKRSCRAPSS